jgi:hypothetical protein
MSALNRNPQNTNYLQPTKFQMVFPKITTMTYFLQSFSLPSLLVEPVIQTSPFVDIPRPGDKIKFGELRVEFIIDEEMWSYQVIYEWMKGIGFPCSFEEYKLMNRQISSLNLDTPQYCDAIITILSGLNNPKLSIHFANLFPVSLSEIQFSTKESSETVVTATATFNYHLFHINR